jgi:hypothetical protein
MHPSRVRVWPATAPLRSLVRALRHYDWVKADQLLTQAAVHDPHASIMVDAIIPARRQTLLGWVLTDFPLLQAQKAAQLLYRHGACPFVAYTFPYPSRTKRGQAPMKPFNIVTWDVLAGRYQGTFPEVIDWIDDALHGRRASTELHDHMAGRAMWFHDAAAWERCIGRDPERLKAALRVAVSYSEHRNPLEKARAKLDWTEARLREVLPAPDFFEVMRCNVLRNADRAPPRSALVTWTRAWQESHGVPSSWSGVLMQSRQWNPTNGAQPDPFWEALRANDPVQMRLCARTLDSSLASREERMEVGQALWRYAITGDTSWAVVREAMKLIPLVQADWKTIIQSSASADDPLWATWITATKGRKKIDDVVAFAQGITALTGQDTWMTCDHAGQTLLHRLCSMSPVRAATLRRLSRMLPRSLWEIRCKGQETPLDVLCDREATRKLGESLRAQLLRDELQEGLMESRDAPRALTAAKRRL